MDMLTDFYLEKCESSAIIFSQVRQVVFHYLCLHKHFFRKLTTLVPLIWVIGHEVLHIRDYKTILFSHIDLFFLIWLHHVLVVAGGIVIFAACRIFSCSMQTQLWHVGSISQTRDQTQVPCVGSLVSQPVDHQGSTSHVDLTLMRYKGVY